MRSVSMARDEKKGPEDAKPRERNLGKPEAGPAARTETPPPAGPHADPALTDRNRTPGAGTLPDPEGEGDEGASITG
jgi:hypothetical protein